MSKLDDFGDLDDLHLLDGLSLQEIEELSEAIDPENELLPAAERQPNQTDKEDTGPYQREHLLKHMEKEALESKVGENYLPFKKETRGKVWKPKPRRQAPATILPDDLSEALDGASVDEIAELAAVLGLHGLLTQEQSAFGDVDMIGKSLRGSGLRKAKPKFVTGIKQKKDNSLNAVNELDLADALEKLKSNDANLTNLNVNNHKDINELNAIETIIDCLQNNTHLKVLCMANTHMQDRHAKDLAEALRKNSTLESLNVESNYITGVGIKCIVQVLKDNAVIKELRIANQSQMAGSQAEDEIAIVLKENKTLLKLGCSFDSRGPQVLVDQYILRNNEIARKERKRLEEE
ncbi:tropomodulin-3-like [Dendronephthya gigantea]|uniref:tropomodulin-3-like n=1 Tax=Dendronephthya gigantea TaxID=151771 RepID=UPI001069279B|nr:tropomodulin-3-like [Dendronephthya gigantea]